MKSITIAPKTIIAALLIQLLFCTSLIAIGFQINNTTSNKSNQANAVPEGTSSSVLPIEKGGTGVNSLAALKANMFQDSTPNTYLNGLAQPTPFEVPYVIPEVDLSSYVASNKLSITIPEAQLTGLAYLQVWGIRDDNQYGMATIDLGNVSSSDKFEVIRGTWHSSSYREWQLAFSYKKVSSNLVITALIDNRTFITDANGNVSPSDTYTKFSGVVKGVRYSTLVNTATVADIDAKVARQVGSVTMGPKVGGYGNVSYPTVTQFGKVVTVNFLLNITTTVPATIDGSEPTIFAVSGVGTNPYGFIVSPYLYSVANGARTYNNYGIPVGSYQIHYSYITA
jgi:hypothetical protein